MRLLITNVQIPFVRGGAEILAEGLRDALVSHGHIAEIVTIPFKWYPADVIPDQMVSARLFDLTAFHDPIDRVIGLKFPAYLIPHPSKSLWMVHQHRDAYELWDNEMGALNWHERGREIRNLIRETDSRILNDEFEARYAISKNVADRARLNNQVALEPLYHPPLNADQFFCGDNEPYILFPSRLSSIKRQYLVIEAMSHVSSPGKLVLTGSPDSKAYMDELKALAERHGVSDRVEFTGYLDEERKRQLMADARAIAFTPYDEDYGYITLEAMLASKPVVTCRDSGGVLEFIDDQINGVVCQPSASEVGDALERLLARPERAREMGAAGRERYDQMEISWANVVEKLTA